MEGKMSVGLLFVIVFLKIVNALIDCKEHADCFIPIEETFRLSWTLSNSGSFNSSKSLEWVKSPNITLKNGTNGITMGGNDSTIWLIKKNATLSDSGQYNSTYDDHRHSCDPCGVVFVFSATLKTQPSTDGKLGVLLQFQDPPLPFPLPPDRKLRMEDFSCPSAKGSPGGIQKYMNDTHWKLLDVELGDRLNLCCHFNVSNDKYSKQFSITPDEPPKNTSCPGKMSSTPETVTSTALKHKNGSPLPLLGGLGLSVSPPIKHLSTALASIVVNSVFHFV